MSHPTSLDASESPDACSTCRRPTAVCVCDRIVSFSTSRRVLILQHPREKDQVLGSAQILTASLPASQIVVGLSWRNLGHALGENKASPKDWAVLFPDRKATGTRVMERGGSKVEASSLKGLIVLDGTWSQAKSLWWRNPWLLRLHQMTLAPKEPSIYGKLRPEPSRRHVSTLESVASALSACGEPANVELELRRIFRTMVQRCRDAKLK